MNRKNRQKHRQNDRQFAALPSGFPACYHDGIMTRSAAGSTAGRAVLWLRGRAGLMDIGPSPSFATLLRRYRVAAGLTQEELAERAGLSARMVGDLERGVSHAPRKDTVALLAQALALGAPERAALVKVEAVPLTERRRRRIAGRAGFTARYWRIRTGTGGSVPSFSSSLMAIA